MTENVLNRIVDLLWFVASCYFGIMGFMILVGVIGVILLFLFRNRL
jgi:hypothetical protein